MDIAVCFDHNYVMPCGVMICSLCINNPNSNLAIHCIIDESVTENDKNLIKSSIKKSTDHNINLYFYIIKDSSIDYPSLGDNNTKKYITKAVYYTMYLTELIPNNINKILYLDCDIIVRHPIKELWNTVLGDKSVAAVPDVAEGLIDKYNRLRYKQTKGYFNSGVLLINLKKLRLKNIFQHYIAFIQKHPDWIKLHDQDLFNRFFFDDKICLPIKYNFQEGFLWKEIFYDFWKYEEQVYEARKDPIILHFTDSKPWVSGCEHPMKDDFFKYLVQTPWTGYKIKKKITYKKIIKNAIRNIFENLGILKPHPIYPSKYIDKSSYNKSNV